MKKAYYFSHDTNAHRDDKILEMRIDYAYKGYGWYWAIVETLAEASGYKLGMNEWTIKGIALDLGIPRKQLIKFIDDCIEKYRLFVKDEKEEYFYSGTLQKRLGIRDSISDKLAAAGRKGANRRWHKDKRIVKENKKKLLYLENVKLTKEEHIKLVNEYGITVAEDYIERLNRYIVEYILSGRRKPYESHYLTIRAWVRKDVKDNILNLEDSVKDSKSGSYVDLRKLKKEKDVSNNKSI